MMIFRSTLNRTIVAFICALMAPQLSLAVNAISESGEIVPNNTYRMGFEPQIKLSDGGGANFGVFVDRRLKDDLSLRGFTGFGDTDFSLGASLKWIPFPDFDRQPAIGGRVRAQFMMDASDSFFGFGFDPLVSKKFEVEQGLLNAFIALPITAMNAKNNSATAVNIVFGTEYSNPDYNHLLFGAELGVEGKDSFSYISGFVTISFDDNFKWIEGN